MTAILPGMEEEKVASALASGKAFVDLTSWRKVDVSGPRALSWLSSLGSADVTNLAPGRAEPTVFSSQGGSRAEVTVALAGPNILVLQDPAQTESVFDLLADARVSEEVAIDDRSDALALFSFPGASVAPDVAGTAFSAPSCVGTGVDVFALADDHDYLLGSLQRGFALASLAQVRAWLEGRSKAG